MKRILYYKFFDGGSEFYRIKPLEYIQDKQLTLVECRDSILNFQLLDSFDTVFLLRPQGQIAIDFIKTAKRWHKTVIIDWDDSPLSLGTLNPLYTQYEHEKKSTIDCITLADEVWVSTPEIKSAFRLYNKNIHVIPNAHDDHAFPVRNKRPFTYNKIATYRGGDSHYGDMYDIGVPEKIINMVNGKKDWRFVFFGQRFHYLENRCGDNYIAYTGGLNMVEYMQWMMNQNACVAFYPLANTKFNRSKSNIFFLEMAYCGSAVFANTGLPEYNLPDVVVTDLKYLECNLEHGDYLRESNEVAWNYIKENLLLSKVNLLRIERLKA